MVDRCEVFGSVSSFKYCGYKGAHLPHFEVEIDFAATVGLTGFGFD
jgi:hypothetical protein